MSTFDGINCFVRYLTLREDRRDGTRNRNLIPEARRVQFDLTRRELYSYGRHFPLARFVPAKRGRRAQWLINGDRWRAGGWSMTNEHQENTRRSISGAIADAANKGMTIESLIVPFSALDGAGIDRDSIRPLHVRADRTETFTNTAKVSRALYEKTLALPTREHCETRSRECDPRGGAITASDTLARGVKLAVTTVSNDSGLTESRAVTAELSRNICYRGAHYGNADNGWSMEWKDYDPPQVTIYLDHSFEVTFTDNGEADTVTAEWETTRHWLGDSLFTADRVSRETCRKCNGAGTADTETVAGVKDSCPHCHGIGTLTVRRRGRFLSSFDYNERAPLYFLAALPSSSRAVTVDMAFEDLAPAAVHAAYARGLAVKRQGDIFLIPTPLTDADVYARAVKRARLTQWTRHAQPRKGEVGFSPALPKAAVIARDKLRRELTRNAMREAMATANGPKTADGFRKAKRRKLRGIAQEIERHTARIAVADNVCGYHCGAYRMGNQSGETCGACGRPKYYDGYTLDNAIRGLASAQERYNAELLEPRKRSSGYASEDANLKRGKSICYGRAVNAYNAAVRTANERFTPLTPIQQIRATLAVHGTAHTATEVAVCKRGVTYVKGTMRHDPTVTNERRQRDHANVALDGALWYLAIRNTVPRQTRGGN